VSKSTGGGETAGASPAEAADVSGGVAVMDFSVHASTDLRLMFYKLKS
jgi:hypothetical protein